MDALCTNFDIDIRSMNTQEHSPYIFTANGSIATERQAWVGIRMIDTFEYKHGNLFSKRWPGCTGCWYCFWQVLWDPRSVRDSSAGPLLMYLPVWFLAVMNFRLSLVLKVKKPRKCMGLTSFMKGMVNTLTQSLQQHYNPMLMQTI